MVLWSVVESFPKHEAEALMKQSPRVKKSPTIKAAKDEAECEVTEEAQPSLAKEEA